MSLYFLDAGGAGLFYLVIGLGLVFIFLAILVEALVMTVMNYHPFKKAMAHSAAANVISLIAGYFLIEASPDSFNIDTVQGFALMFLATILIEGGILILMNRQKPLSRTTMVTIVMNLVTYVLLFLFTVLS